MNKAPALLLAGAIALSPGVAESGRTCSKEKVTDLRYVYKIQKLILETGLQIKTLKLNRVNAVVRSRNKSGRVTPKIKEWIKKRTEGYKTYSGTVNGYKKNYGETRGKLKKCLGR